ncbi:MAG: toll/interleukin-1 receptor domain-containing protein [Spartobacteria bacterium]
MVQKSRSPHSSRDSLTASGMKQALQNKGIRCWKAPDDILPGESWPSAIMRAISGCRVMILVWINPLFPDHRSAPNAVAMAARQKQIPSSSPVDSLFMDFCSREGAGILVAFLLLE